MSRSNDHKPVSFRHTSRALPIALLRVREIVMEPIRQVLHAHGLTEQKWRVLRALDEDGCMDQSRIAHETCLLLPSLTRILRSMEADELVTRTRNPQDRRGTLVEITDRGRGLLLKILPITNLTYQQIEREFGSEKLEALLDLLEDMRQINL